MISLLPNPVFLPWLLAAIGRARCSIVVVNYLAVMDPVAPSREQSRSRSGRCHAKGPVAEIAEALEKACRRGVKVEIILEGSNFRENMVFYQTLRDAGADVWMDTSLTFIHTKAVLVDDRVLCVGSHNLTTSALTSHQELSIAVRNVAVVRKFHAELGRMTEQKRQISADVCRKGTWLPLSVIVAAPGSKSVPPLVALKRAISPDAYLLYLLLCRLDNGRPRPLAIDAERWARELGLPSSTTSARVRVAAMLEFMDQKLGVVRFDRQNEVVIRTFSKANVRSLRATKGSETIPCPQRGSLFIPDSFWKYGWHQRLRVEAIHHYVAGEAERIQSPFAPWWRLTRDEIAARYGFQKQLVNRAQEGLRRAGLLEVLFEVGQAPTGRYVRYRNYFRQNPFYDVSVLEARMRALAQRYPQNVFSVAKDLLATICEDSDLRKMAALCESISEKGVPAAKRVVRTIRCLSPNSTKRTFEYVLELLEGGAPAFQEG